MKPTDEHMRRFATAIEEAHNFTLEDDLIGARRALSEVRAALAAIEQPEPDRVAYEVEFLFDSGTRVTATYDTVESVEREIASERERIGYRHRRVTTRVLHTYVAGEDVRIAAAKDAS
jgi:hypothetical protein